MEIVPKKDGERKRKRVRFTLPDNAVDEEAHTIPKRKRSPIAKNRKKCQIRKRFTRIDHHVEGDGRHGLEDKLSTDKQGTSCCLSGGDEHGKGECLQVAELPGTAFMNINENSKIRTDRGKPTKIHGDRVSFRKGKSDVSLGNGVKTSRERHGKKSMISKKSYFKGKDIIKHHPNTKRCDDYAHSSPKKSKKRKAASMSPKKKVRTPHISRHHTFRSKSSNSSNTIQIRARSKSSKLKKAVCKAKLVKQRSVQKRLKEQAKKLAQKKLALKRSMHKKSTLKRKKLVHTEIDKKVDTSRRNIEIKPIEREMDIVEPMRISLLKYITFDIADRNTYECCRKYCWDDWEQVYIDDIIDDHD